MTDKAARKVRAPKINLTTQQKHTAEEFGHLLAETAADRKPDVVARLLALARKAMEERIKRIHQERADSEIEATRKSFIDGFQPHPAPEGDDIPF